MPLSQAHPPGPQDTPPEDAADDNDDDATIPTDDATPEDADGAPDWAEDPDNAADEPAVTDEAGGREEDCVVDVEPAPAPEPEEAKARLLDGTWAELAAMVEPDDPPAPEDPPGAPLLVPDVEAVQPARTTTTPQPARVHPCVMLPPDGLDFAHPVCPVSTPANAGTGT